LGRQAPRKNLFLLPSCSEHHAINNQHPKELDVSRVLAAILQRLSLFEVPVDYVAVIGRV
jgi:hypothetical protein